MARSIKEEDDFFLRAIKQKGFCQGRTRQTMVTPIVKVSLFKLNEEMH